jgi:histidinol-phosphatase
MTAVKSLPDKDIIEYIEFADKLADAAALVTLQHFKQPVGIDNKLEGNNFDPVTIADRDAEAAIRALIEARYPDHGIIGEEHGSVREDAEFIWVLDPVDGTRAFISGVPTWGTLIALLHHREPVLGIIDQPYLKERYLGSPLGSSLNGTPISTRACASLDKAIISTIDPAMFSSVERPIWNAIEQEALLARFSLDCYAYAVLAAGFMDMVIESGMEIYDYMALIPVIRGAGGIVSDWQGNESELKGQIVASGDPALHAKIIKLTQGG